MDWTRVLNLNIDVISGVNAALFLALFGSILAFLLGISTLRRGLKLVYFRKRQEAIARGWKLIIMSIVLAGASWALNNYAEPAFYTVFPPSPTITLTPTITETATITLPPTMTLSPTVSETPSITNTPALPDSLRAMATSQVDPGTEVLFSPIQFAEEIGDDGFPIEPSVRFMNPLRKLNGFYSYDKLVLGTQISFVWMRLDDRVALCESTVVWDISTGGYNFVTCEPEDPDDWLPGAYELQVFLGSEWFMSEGFVIEGMPLTPTATASEVPTATDTPPATGTWTPTATRTATVTGTVTLTATITPTGTDTLTPTVTWTPTNTSTNTATPTATRTPRPTDTRQPTPTLTSTPTLVPTRTPRPTDTVNPVR
ncbi:hypothetical protein BEQ56_11865 [Anaerolineaceae bacterium oral taxon 439]|nr:hypothetical protein BEQ56_11865 [Anaerolineaceae bacterium oral taxon 439]